MAENEGGTPLGGADATVVTTGGTRAQRKLRAAENDVGSIEYALTKARPALKHAEAQVAKYEKQLAEAQTRLAHAKEAVAKEGGKGGPPARKVARGTKK